VYKTGKLTSTWSLVIIVFVFILFVSALGYMADIFTDKNVKGDINLTTDSLEYIIQIKNLTGDGNTNISNYKPTEEELKDPVLFSTNESSGNLKDYAIEFYTTKEKGSSVRSKIQALFSIPSKTWALLRIPTGNLSWFIDIVGWLLGIVIILALINLWKKGAE